MTFTLAQEQALVTTLQTMKKGKSPNGDPDSSLLLGQVGAAAVANLFHGLAQNDNCRALLDAAEAINSADITALAKGYLALGRAVALNRIGNIPASFKAVELARQVIFETGSKALALEVSLESGVQLSWLGQFNGAVNQYLQALSFAIELNATSHQITLWFRLGQLFFETTDYQQALHYFQMAEHKAQASESDNRDQLLRINLEIGQCFLKLKKTQDALDFIDGLDCPAGAGYVALVYHALRTKILTQAGQGKAAMVALSQVKNCQVKGDQWQEAVYHYTKAIAVAPIEPQLALDCAKKAEDHFRAKGLVYHLWDCLLFICQLQCQLTLMAEAEATLRAARKIAMEQSNRLMVEAVDHMAVTEDISAGLDLRENVTVSEDYRGAGSGYTLLTQLGAGGYGQVYKAFDMVTQETVAFKIFLAPEEAAESGYIDRDNTLYLELSAAARLNHPLLLTPKTYGTTKDGNHYITSPFVDGVPLRAKMTGPQSAASVLKWFDPLLDGLLYAHDQGVYHCDIKPENILIDQTSGQMYLIDFGSAHLQTGRTIGVSGTLPYMCPDHQKGKSPSAAYDVFALTVLLYECLIGELPFDPTAPDGKIAFWRAKGQAIKRAKAFDLPADVIAVLKAGLCYSSQKSMSLSTMRTSLQAALMEVGDLS